MRREISFDEVTTPPEFESRCDMFVNRVKRYIVPRHRTIQINPYNKTTEPTVFDNDIQEMIKQFVIRTQGPDAWEKHKNISTGIFLDQDIQSLTENIAFVEILGYKGKKSIRAIEKAIKQIRTVAKRYRGEFVPNKDGKMIIDDKFPDYPNAHLVFIFKD